MNFRSRYDFVIVGGGTAGLLIAARLAENSESTILIIESGKQPPSECQNRSNYISAFGTPVDWCFATTPQRHLGGRRIRWPAGKMLGGSSALNAQIYVRGDLADIDQWIPNSSHWNRPKALEAFCEFESYFGLDLHKSPELQFESSIEFLMACENAGLPMNHDFNSGNQIGYGRFMQTGSESHRVSSWSRLGNQLHTHPNVDIAAGCNALQLQIQQDRVSGVTIKDAANRKETIGVKNKLVVACGTVQSPLLLQRSGIGNAQALKEAGINCKIHLPFVGENLQDHLCVPLIFKLTNALGQKRIHVSNRCEVGGFDRLEQSNGNRADFQIHVTPNNYLKPIASCDGSYISLVINTLRPASRGSIKIQSDDCEDPVIDANYLDAPNDLDDLLAAIHQTQPIIEQLDARCQFATMKPKSTQLNDQEQLRKWIERFAMTIYHPVGTCKMGRQGDSVVDESLKIHGIDNCFVADASVIPNLPRGNTQATVYMIAWRLSQSLSS